MRFSASSPFSGSRFLATVTKWQVSIPSWRSDIVHEACLVEEVVRINGFDAIPATPLPRETIIAEASPQPKPKTSLDRASDPGCDAAWSRP